MQTSDWAAEAYEWYESYHTAIGIGQYVVAKNKLEDYAIIDDDVVEKFTNHSILQHVNLLNWESTVFELLEQERGWKPFLRRLPQVTNNRLLTLLRRNLLVSLVDESNVSNQSLLSRQQWAFIEGLRWKLGYYNRTDVLQVIQQQYGANKNDDQKEDISSYLKTKSNDGVGRYVVYEGIRPIQPGEIILETKPYAVATYDYDASSMLLCFHCGNDTDRNPVRELTLQCTKCKIWSFCNSTCRSEHSMIHDMECPNVTKLLDKCKAIDIPLFKGLLVYRTILRILLFPETSQDILQLECHVDDHARENPEFTQKATEMASFIVNSCLTNAAIPADSIINQEMIRNLFLAVNINAIGIGSGAVGLFPGLPSMFNHSCNEIITHSLDEYDGIVRFRAIDTINPGDECHISYTTNLQDPTPIRTAPLRQYKFFTCQCTRCISPTEEGRMDAIQGWKDCMNMLNTESTNDTIATYRKLVSYADILFPKYFVTKGWIYEECAHALLQDSRLKFEAYDLLVSARQQYSICRGENSILVARIDTAIHELQLEKSNNNMSNEVSVPVVKDQPISDNTDIDEADDDNDLIIAQGWNQILYEIKLFEPETIDFSDLAVSMKEKFSNRSEIQWSDGYRLSDIGYGIQSLILSCQLNESILLRHDLADEITDTFDDLIQHVDIVTLNEYN